MSEILGWLEGGDLRSDGLADQAAEFVLQNPDVLPDLLSGLNDSRDLIQGRSADALEKVARVRPDLLIGHLNLLEEAVQREGVAMLKMHLAMLLGHLAACNQQEEKILDLLLVLLEVPGAFTKSWAVSSLCILSRRYPRFTPRVFQAITAYHDHPGAAVRTRVRKALELLGNPEAPFPPGWIKCSLLLD